jgi:hypothetical protein
VLLAKVLTSSFLSVPFLKSRIEGKWLSNHQEVAWHGSGITAHGVFSGLADRHSTGVNGPYQVMDP